MLWTAIACVQRTDPEVVSVVYTGDDVSKDAMIAKVEVRLLASHCQSSPLLTRLTGTLRHHPRPWHPRVRDALATRARRGLDLAALHAPRPIHRVHHPRL